MKMIMTYICHTYTHHLTSMYKFYSVSDIVLYLDKLSHLSIIQVLKYILMMLILLMKKLRLRKDKEHAESPITIY